MKKICYIFSEATSAYRDLGVLRGEIEYFINKRWDVFCICGKRTPIIIENGRGFENLKVFYVDLIREPSFMQDVMALFQIVFLLIKIRPSVVNCAMPKGAFIGIIASWLVRIPKRIYTVSAAKFETMKGKRKSVYIWLERLTCALSTQAIFVSRSLQVLFEENKIVNPVKSCIIGLGSAGGIDSSKFNKESINFIEQSELKSQLGLTVQTIILGYFGRINKDKGVEDLVQAFLRIAELHKNCKLLLIGDFDSNDAVSEECKMLILNHESIIFRSFTKNIKLYYSIIDIFILPTYREGFPTVLLEALSMGIPIISTDATGARDAFEHNLSGLMYRKGDKDALFDCMKLLIENSNTRIQFGNYGAKWVEINFQPLVLWQKLEKIYAK
jgi:glycosyltransferase involved in cell wall biosynthesis